MSESVVKIFVSYSHQDPEYLRKDSLLGFLKGLEGKENVTFWTDEDIIGSDDWDQVIKDNLQQAQIALVLVSQHFLDSDYCQNVEIERLLGQTSYLFPVILSPCDWEEHEWLKSTQFLPGGEETIETHFTDAGPLKGLFLKIRMQLKKIIREARASLQRELSESAPVVQTASEPTWSGSPFRGLLTYTQRHAEIFFGRNAEIQELIARLANGRFLAVVGASGSGKSSLVAAGLLPRIADLPGGANWLTVRLTPGGLSDDPFEALAARLAPDLETFDLTGRDIADMLRGGGDLADLVELMLEDRPPEAKLLLFIDQFEELFTVTHPDHHQPFIAMLAKVEQAEQVRTVLTLRADFYHRCVEEASLAGLLRNGSFPLAAPGVEALLEMMTRPAALAGLRFEAGLPGRILEDTGRDPGALALMAFALEQLYEHRDQQNGTLTHAAYDNLGGVQGVVNNHADATYGQLNDAGRSALGRVFKELVEVDPQRGVPTRKRAAMTHFGDEPAAMALIERFTEARLLVRNRAANQEDVVEVAHEAVLTHWEVLTNWIEARFDDFRLLRQVKLAAAEWKQQRRAEVYLWPHERLAPVADMLVNLEPQLSRAEWAFVRPRHERILRTIKRSATSHEQRAALGDELAKVGDPRPGVGLNAAQLPDIVWCEVPGGSVTLEKEAGTFNVEPGYIGKFPVTWAQYRCFLEAEDGYANPVWWEGFDEDELEAQPGEQHRQLDNHPAENVSWYDAMAYCRWLSSKMGYAIQLPTDWEWQQAATGGNSVNEYPWGTDRDGSLANTEESRLSRTTAVGMYPHGASPVSALDMSGNVMEWCLSQYENQKDSILSYAHRRVLRGGSWFDRPINARAIGRDGSIPTFRSDLLGFRLWCSSPIRF